MKREINFRGKVKRAEVSHSSHGDWVKGNYILDSNDVAHILCTHPLRGDKLFEIDPETVGQFTGLKDENGMDIYEGDIIGFVKDGKIAQLTYIVKWIKGGFWIDDRGYGGKLEPQLRELEDLAHSCGYKTRVVGNIFDNHKLLKGGEE